MLKKAEAETSTDIASTGARESLKEAQEAMIKQRLADPNKQLEKARSQMQAEQSSKEKQMSAADQSIQNLHDVMQNGSLD